MSLYQQKHFSEAIELETQVLAIAQRASGPESQDTGIALQFLASMYRDSGQPDKAIPLFERAIAIAEKVNGPEGVAVAPSLDGLAAVYLFSGEYDKAEPLYKRAVAILEKARGPTDTDTGIMLASLGTLYLTSAQYPKAEPLLKRALPIYEKAYGPSAVKTATVIANLGVLYSDTGAYEKSERLLQRALDIREKALGPKSEDTASSLNSLGALYAHTGQYEKAEPLYKRALEIRDKSSGNPLDIATSLNNLADLYLAKGLYKQAEPLFKRALALTRENAGVEHPVTADALENLANLYRATGAYDKARPLLEQARLINQKALDPENLNGATTLRNLALLYAATGQHDEAEPLLEQAQGIEETGTERFLLAGSEARQEAYLQSTIRSAFSDVSFMLDHPTARASKIGLTSVLRIKGRTLDAVSDSTARLRRSVAPQDRELLEQLSAVARQISTLTFSPPAQQSPESIRDRAVKLTREQEKLQTQLATRSAAFRQAVTPITVESVQKALPANAVLVEWFRYQHPDQKQQLGAPRYVVLMLKRTGEPVAIDLGPAKPIEDLVEEHRRSVSDPSNTTYQDAAQELSDKLLKPVLAHLTQGEHLLLSPDGALSLVPFAALPDSQGAPLVQHREITYLTSGRDLLRMAAAPAPHSGDVIVAHPDYGPGTPTAAHTAPSDDSDSAAPARSADMDRSGLVFKPLPGTANEAKALAALLKLDAAHVLTGDRATEAHLRELHGPRILHLATHAFFLTGQELMNVPGLQRAAPQEAQPLAGAGGENPLLRAGLALSGANARRSGAHDDGILTGVEAAQLDLEGTELVALSACDTGVGVVQAGQGVYGLRRALVLAGAQSQLVSLWKVSDTATQSLMVDYYQRLLKGEGRSAALRSAQLAVMADPARRHPFYWAAFIPIGDWKPLSPAAAHAASKPAASAQRGRQR